jgi:hypothetical protein
MYVPAELVDTNLDVVAYLPRLLTQSFRGAERLVSEQFRKVRDGEFDDRSFLALKQGLLAAETARWEHNRERALAMAHAFVARGGLGRAAALLPAPAGGDAGRRAAGRGEYFGERRLILRSRAGYPKKTRLTSRAIRR